MAVQKAVAENWLKVTGCPHRRRLRPVGNLADADLQPADTDRLHRHHRPAPAVDRLSIRDDDGNEVPLGAARRDLRHGPAGDGRLLERPDETAKVMTADGFFRTGDIGVMDERRLHQDRRPQEGHDPGVGLQRLSERDRGSGRGPSGRAGVRGDRRAGYEFGRSRKLFVVKKDPSLTDEDMHRVLQGATHRLQAAEARSSSAPSCRRPMSARSCGASCATKRRQRHRPRVTF